MSADKNDPATRDKIDMEAIAIPQGKAKLVSREELHNSPAWAEAFRAHCKDHRYYEIVETTLRDGFEHHYLVLEDESGNVRAIQPLFFLQQNLVEGVPGTVRSIVDLVRKTFPRFLTMRTLMVGCAAGEGHLGARSANDERWAAEALLAALQQIARARKASLVVLKDFPSRYRDALENFSANGYARIPSMPLTHLALTSANFEEFLDTLGKATRKGLRRKFRKAERADKIDMEVLTDIAPHVDEIYPLYEAVHNKSALKFETLTKDYFCSLSREMPERVRFFLWRQNGKIIAFSLVFINEDTIYDECLGMDYAVALELSLYFYTLRDVISWAIEHGLKCYCSTPLNYDPKLHLGCRLIPLDLYVRHTAPMLNPIFHRAVKYLEPTRHDPVLRQFPNANEL
ncbi:MAG: GNAT family N-acetyltransferase [Spartobacteria bacterium]